MIILDTNVVSEMMKDNPHPAVADWFKGQDNSQIYITVLTVAEIKYGISLLPEGRRKKTLDFDVSHMFNTVFKDRILPFDCDAAYRYPVIHQHRKAVGKTMTVMDAELAAICTSNDATLATRNTGGGGGARDDSGGVNCNAISATGIMGLSYNRSRETEGVEREAEATTCPAGVQVAHVSHTQVAAF
ncbi:MAG: type II toxin-antitoxin system VapC family toxin [Coriobacteriales bacterium]|jgi:predicted nucleic acid-binding protein|nr:type II toxin-antitoxin system VapC family toxin [Coriobacteriales bacterium]